jgi:hypothetical protein
MINYDKLQIFYGWCVDLSVVKEDFYNKNMIGCCIFEEFACFSLAGIFI